MLQGAPQPFPLIKKGFQKYLLSDCTFLHDYIILQTKQTYPYQHGSDCIKNRQEFIAQISGTNQLVKFVKIEYDENLLHRFQTLVELYERSVILADNLFILEENGQLYFYIIQAFIPHHFGSYANPKQSHKYNKNSLNFSQLSEISFQDKSRFTTLQTYINSPDYFSITLEAKMKMADKIKVLVECVHSTGQAFMGLTSKNIIVDLEDQQNIYLSPFNLQSHFPTDRYFCSYLSPQLLNLTLSTPKSQPPNIKIQMMFNNDIWSYGCILLQLMFYSWPPFYSPDNYIQLHNITNFLQSSNIQDKDMFASWEDRESLVICIQELTKSFGVSIIQRENTENQKQLQQLSNLLWNCLSLNSENRSLKNSKQLLSFEAPEETKSVINQTSPIYQFPKSRDPQKDTELRLDFLYLSNISIQRQLQINVFLDKRYCFYISPNSKNMNKNHTYKLDKTISIEKGFRQIHKILKNPIIIELVQNCKSTQIQMTLSAFLIHQQGNRIWKKPIISSYKPKQCEDFKNCSIKIKSWISTSQVQTCFLKEIENEQRQKQISAAKQRLPLKALTPENKNKSKQDLLLIQEQSKENKTKEAMKYRSCFDEINENLKDIQKKWKVGKTNEQEYDRNQKQNDDEKSMDKCLNGKERIRKKINKMVTKYELKI